jgi:hypothetical protein
VNWDVVGAVSEFIAAMGVVASLVYVAGQMKTSNLASKVDAKLRVAEMMVDFQNMIIANPELHEIMISGRRDIEKLSKQDYLQFSNLALKASWFLSAAHFMHQSKAISDDDWHEFRAISDYWARSPGYQVWWQKIGAANFSGDFRRFIDKEIGGAGTGG